MGACVPPCQDACAAGAAQCAPNGTPQTCAAGPTGCTVWTDQASCASGNTCYQGVCHLDCSDGEVDDCPLGMECTSTTDGNVCLPGTDGGTVTTPDAGTHAPPDQQMNGTDDPNAGNSGPVVAKSGCGCNGGSGFAAPLLALLLLGRRRK